MKMCECGSYAVNIEGKLPDGTAKCDVCHWKTRALKAEEALKAYQSRPSAMWLAMEQTHIDQEKKPRKSVAPREGGVRGKYDSIIVAACTVNWLTVKAMRFSSKVFLSLPASAISTRCLALFKAGVLERRSLPPRLGVRGEYEYRVKGETA
jgi:hypothetical protein